MKKDFFLKLKEDKQKFALYKLIMWIIGLIILYLVVSVISILTPNTKNDVSNKTPEVNETVELTYFEKLDYLINNDYEFKYEITKNNTKTTFDGSKKGEIIEGYKQDNNGTIKYTIKNNQVYQIILDEEIIYSELYTGLNESLLDLNYIIDLLKSYDEENIDVLEENAITNYDYDFKDKNIKITVFEKNNRIYQFIITTDLEKYTLTYS